jgi:crotonobetainyl-CoA:carnitine CoA-transferase CaiB-like acyl-CoA transferase
MSVPTTRQSIRDVVVSLFPFLAGFVAGAKGRGLAIRAASGLLHLAGGPDDPPVHRMGDAGTAGTITAPTGTGTIVWTLPDGSTQTIAVVCASPGAPAVITITPGAAGFEVVTKSTGGSKKVTCA